MKDTRRDIRSTWLWSWKGIAVAVLTLAVSFGAVCGLLLTEKHVEYAVQLDGTLIGYATDRVMVITVSETVKERLSAKIGAPVAYRSGLKLIEEESYRNRTYLTETELVVQCTEALERQLVSCCAVTLNENQTVYVESQELFDSVAQKITAEYADTIHSKLGIEYSVVPDAQITYETVKMPAVAIADTDTLYSILTGKPEVDPLTDGWYPSPSLSVMNIGDNISHVLPSESRSFVAVNTDDEGTQVRLLFRIEKEETAVVTVEHAVTELTDDTRYPYYQRSVVEGRDQMTFERYAVVCDTEGNEISRTVTESIVLCEAAEETRVTGTKAYQPGVATGTWIRPLDDDNFAAHITSRFMESREDIDDGAAHVGLDIAQDEGTPIYASDGGKIYACTSNESYGNYIRIDHGNGYTSIYAHMSSFAEGIKAGVEVSQGQVIGYVGNTGNSYGAHLHFEIRYLYQWKNPLDFLDITDGGH